MLGNQRLDCLTDYPHVKFTRDNYSYFSRVCVDRFLVFTDDIKERFSRR